MLSSEHFEDCYRKAEKAREMVKKAFDAAFAKYDFLVSPTSPMTAPEIGKSAEDPLAAYLSDLCTVPASLAGIPAISVPVYGESALPCGVQLMGRRCGEQEILGAAYYLEQHGCTSERRADA